MRNHFDEQLQQLNQDLTKMGSLCEEIISLAAKALTGWEDDLMKRMASMDAEIDKMERTIESLCLRLLLQQQPVATDLRTVSAALKMITDMERIGDQAEDIAEIITFLNGRVAPESIQIREMAREPSAMVTGSVEAYVDKDVERAEKVLAHDDIVDTYFECVKKNLIEMIAKKPEDGEFALDLLMIAKYFERIGDHATNIAEWVLFSVTGVHKDFQ